MPSPAERSPADRAAQAEQNRNRLLAAEAAALALLVRRRKEAVDFGIAHSLPVSRIAERVQSHVATGIAESRILSRAAGIQTLDIELSAVGVELEDMGAVARAQVARDIRRGNVFAKNYAERWARKAEGDTPAKAAKAANAETLGSLKRTAVTESAEAFNDGRSRAADEVPQTRVQLLKVWDAQLDKQTCPICESADGTIVGIRESFSIGEPGAVHPWCRCTWQALTLSEHEGDSYIEQREPARVISLPVRAPAQSAPPVAAVAGKTEAVAKSIAAESKNALRESEKLAEKDIKASLKAVGVKATGDVRGTLKDLFGHVPPTEDLHALLGLESLSKFGRFRGDVEFNPNFGIKFSGATSNGAVSIGRKLAKDETGKLIAKRDYLFLSQAAQGKKLGAAVLREQVTAYEKLGVHKITLNSAEIGRYYWPKIGFDNPGAFASTQRRAAQWMANQGIPNAERIAAETTTMRDIATLQVGERKIGKDFLLSSEYSGSYLQLELKHGEPGFEAFKREVGLIGKKR